MHILSHKFQYLFFQLFMHHVRVVVQVAQAEFTTDKPPFVELNVIRKQCHCVSTELETLTCVLIFTLFVGMLPCGVT